MQFDAVIVGGGLAGLVAAAELADLGRRVVILEQEGENSLGGQAFWSLGGLFFVDSPEQRRMKIRGQPRPGAAGLDGLGRVRPRRRTNGRAGWPRPMSISRPARCEAGSTRWACAGFRSSAGPSAAAGWRMATAIRCRAFT
jgi:choline dehydrogenase-like flavoprotein